MTDETQSVEDVMEGVTLEDETQAQTETETKENEAVDSSPQDDQNPVDDDAGNKPQDGVQRRINKLTAEKYGAKRENDALKKELAELKNKAEPLVEPLLEDFDYDEKKHTDALIEYQVKKQIATEQQSLQDNQAEAQAQQRVSDFAEKEAEFALKHSDYNDVVQHMPPLPNETFEAITSLENGAEVAYHLARNLDVANEIAALPPHLAALKLGQIASKVTLGSKKIETSNAPSPVDTIAGQSSTVRDGIDPLIAGAKFE